MPIFSAIFCKGFEERERLRFFSLPALRRLSIDFERPPRLKDDCEAVSRDRASGDDKSSIEKRIEAGAATAAEKDETPLADRGWSVTGVPGEMDSSGRLRFSGDVVLDGPPLLLSAIEKKFVLRFSMEVSLA